MACTALPRRRRCWNRKARTCLAVLPDGTNDEGEDLAEPLGIGSGDLKDVVLYGTEFSPPCVKLRCLLGYYGMPFKEVQGKHPSSDYKRIPVVELNGRQVNDSHIIYKNLVPLLTGAPLTDEELAWEKTITFKFQPAIEVELFGNGGDIARFARLEGIPKVLAQVFGPLLGLLIGNVFKGRYDFELPSSTYGKEFREALDAKAFFHGDSPGPVDLCLYGTYAGLAESDCTCAATFLKESDLESWHQRMSTAVGPLMRAG